MEDALLRFRAIFGDAKPLIAMIHTAALPGTPKYGGNFDEIVRKAVDEALLYQSLGIPALMIENMHDVPYLNRVAGPEITAAMSIIGYEVKQKTGLPVGIQILAGANREALAAALAAGLDFVRAEGFVYGHLADEGWMDADAGELLRYRKNISAENILIFTDIKKKHGSHALSADLSVADFARAAEFFLSDGLIVTGTETGQPASPEDLSSLQGQTRLPVLIGSGITAGNLPEYFSLADGFIVGSYLKKDGKWFNAPDAKRVEKITDIWRKLINREK